MSKKFLLKPQIVKKVERTQLMNRARIERLYLVTASENKFQDYQFLLGKYADLRWARLNVEDLVTTDLAILIRRKIELVKPMLPHLPFLVEQTNLLIHAWRDLPGSVSGLFIDSVGASGICKMLEPFPDRAATVVTDLGFHAENGRVYVFHGEQKGHIAPNPQGSQSYGWDAIFVPEGETRTLAEMPLEQRNSISTRKLAVAQFYEAILEEEHAGVLLQNRIRLRELLARHFSKTELESLCFDLGIDKEELPEGVKKELAQEIILYCERHDKMELLLKACREQRPTTEWPEEL